jgi:hypothetical protein
MLWPYILQGEEFSLLATAFVVRSIIDFVKKNSVSLKLRPVLY